MRTMKTFFFIDISSFNACRQNRCMESRDGKFSRALCHSRLFRLYLLHLEMSFWTAGFTPGNDTFVPSNISSRFCNDSFFCYFFFELFISAMLFLPWNFAILQFCGIWRPAQWSDGWKKYFYSVYTISSMLLIYTFALSGLIQIALSESLDEGVNSSFLALSVVGICYKMTNWVLHHNNIIVLIDILNNEVCRPRGNEENAIQMKFDRMSRWAENNPHR